MRVGQRRRGLRRDRRRGRQDPEADARQLIRSRPAARQPGRRLQGSGIRRRRSRSRIRPKAAGSSQGPRQDEPALDRRDGLLGEVGRCLAGPCPTRRRASARAIAPGREVSGDARGETVASLGQGEGADEAGPSAGAKIGVGFARASAVIAARGSASSRKRRVDPGLEPRFDRRRAPPPPSPPCPPGRRDRGFPCRGRCVRRGARGWRPRSRAPGRPRRGSGSRRPGRPAPVPRREP